MILAKVKLASTRPRCWPPRINLFWEVGAEARLIRVFSGTQLMQRNGSVRHPALAIFTPTLWEARSLREFINLHFLNHWKEMLATLTATAAVLVATAEPARWPPIS